MKNINFFIIGLLSLCLSCSSADYDIIENQVYLASAANSSSGAETVILNDGADVKILVRLAKKENEDIEVSLKLAPQLIQKYNLENESEYLSIPNFQFPADTRVVIPAGQISAVFDVRIEDFETKGNRYALAIELGDVTKGKVDKADLQSRFLYLLAKPLRVSVPVMSGVNNAMVKTLPTDNWGIITNEWSLECWSKMSAFSINNQAIFNLGSANHEIYIRFGDANRPYNYLQVKTLGGQVQTASNLVANRWYHWAFVYDGVFLNIYRDGELDVKFQPPSPAGGSVKIDYVEMISSGSTYFRASAHLGQVRLWRKAISKTQIMNNMYFDVNPNNPSLIAYWPMDEGQGSIFNDISGNGHHATAGNGILKSWATGVDFRN